MSDVKKSSSSSSPSEVRYTSFEKFYPFYLSEHSNRINRRLHLVGTLIGITVFVASFLSGRYPMMPTGFLIGYAFAWAGHFVFQKNKPATFKYPVYSFMGDMRMLFETLTGRRKF